MDKFFIPGLIIFGFIALIFVVYLICDAVKVRYGNIKDEALDRLKQRIKYLEDNIVEEWRIGGDIKVLTKKVDAVYKWRQNVVKGYCYKLIEFEKEKGKMHFLVVGPGPVGQFTYEARHIEWDKDEECSPQDRIKLHAKEITLEQATDYLKQGYLWVPAYEKEENWPAINGMKKEENWPAINGLME